MHKERGLGVTEYKPEKTYNGFTLFTPNIGEPGTTWLIDMHGRLLHRWRLPDVVRLHAELLPSGNLLVGTSKGKPQPLATHAASAESDDNSDAPSRDKPVQSLWAGGQIVELDWEGNVVWQYDDPHLNTHDRIRMRNGNTLIHKYVQVPPEIRAKVKGGYVDDDSELMWNDCLQEIAPDDSVAWEWIAHEHLDPEVDSLHPMAPRCIWGVSNTLAELPDGNIMISCQFICRIYIIDKRSGKIKWRWGYPEVTFQHQPSMMDNGNVLLLDNRRWVPFHGAGYSRVIEVNSKTNEIEWEYVAENPGEFLNPVMGGCQRLPNGNTLICQTISGRLFEISPSGETVWDYTSPFFDMHSLNPTLGRTNMIHRAYRYGPDYPGLQGKKLRPERLELWNRLYGPYSFGTSAQGSGAAIEDMPFEEERAPVEQETISPVTEQGSPSAAAPSNTAEKVRRRLEKLGYG